MMLLGWSGQRCWSASAPPEILPDGFGGGGRTPVGAPQYMEENFGLVGGRAGALPKERDRGNVLTLKDFTSQTNNA